MPIIILFDLSLICSTFMQYKSPLFHTVIRIHLILLSSHILVFAFSFYLHGANDNVNVTATYKLKRCRESDPVSSDSDAAS